MSRPLVIVVGSINEDLVVTAERLPSPGETVTGGVFEVHGGGKGANQAIAAARMGAAVVFVGAVGNDAFGRRAAGRLEDAGLDLTHVARLDDYETGIAVIVVDREGENQIAVAPGANAVIDAALVGDAFDSIPAGPGVLLVNLEVGDEALIAAVDLATERDLTVVVNPAPARALANSVLDRGPILTPNQGEALALSGRRDVEAAARALSERTGAPVVTTRGAAGALILDRDGARTVPAIAVEAVDTTGAGDVFNGVFATRIAAGDDLDEAVRWAVAASGLAITEAGARSNIGPMDVDAWLESR